MTNIAHRPEHGRQPYKVQLGRSLPTQAGRPTAEFVRVELAKADDVTVYLNDPLLEFGLPNVNAYTVSCGNGGTSWSEIVLASNRGTVLHYVASEVIVRAEVTPFAGGITPAVPARIQASAGFGRPIPQVRYRTIDGSPTAPGATAEIDLSPWCVAVQAYAFRDLETDPIASALNAQVAEVIQVLQNTGVRVDVGGTTNTPLSEWALPRPVGVFTNVLRFTNTNPALGPSLRFAIAETIVH